MGVPRATGRTSASSRTGGWRRAGSSATSGASYALEHRGTAPFSVRVHRGGGNHANRSPKPLGTRCLCPDRLRAGHRRLDVRGRAGRERADRLLRADWATLAVRCGRCPVSWSAWASVLGSWRRDRPAGTVRPRRCDTHADPKCDGNANADAGAAGADHARSPALPAVAFQLPVSGAVDPAPARRLDRDLLQFRPLPERIAHSAAAWRGFHLARECKVAVYFPADGSTPQARQTYCSSQTTTVWETEKIRDHGADESW